MKSQMCFDSRPYTRISSWGRDLKNLIKYLKLNDLEADGIPRKNGRILTAIWTSDPPIHLTQARSRGNVPATGSSHKGIGWGIQGQIHLQIKVQT